MRKRTPTADDLRVWRHVLRDVTPLDGRQLPDADEPDVQIKGESPVKRSAAAQSQPVRANGVRPAAANLYPVTPPGPLPGIDRRTADRLRRGRLEVQGRIDLHGMTQAEGHGALVSFLQRSYALGRRMVLVITGKGTFSGKEGVLRNRVPRWLADAPLRDKVLAYHPAQLRDGGEGALYVLLRRHR